MGSIPEDSDNLQKLARNVVEETTDSSVEMKIVALMLVLSKCLGLDN